MAKTQAYENAKHKRQAELVPLPGGSAILPWWLQDIEKSKAWVVHGVSKEYLNIWFYKAMLNTLETQRGCYSHCNATAAQVQKTSLGERALPTCCSEQGIALTVL